MTRSPRIAHAQRLKAQLDQLHIEALAAGFDLMAHMIGAASEAAAEIIETRRPPLLRLVKNRPVP